MHLGLLSADHGFGRDDWLAGAGRMGLEGVEVEIGPGNCGRLLAAARACPTRLHVGIEVLASPLARVRSGGSLPPNLHLLHGDGGWIVRHLLAPASIDALHVYFPDPWWKKRHHKRRLFQPAFCAAAAGVLVPGGAVHVVTDVAPLFREIATHLEEAGLEREPWDREEVAEACGAYERKYRQQGRIFEQALFRRT